MSRKYTATALVVLVLLGASVAAWRRGAALRKADHAPKQAELSSLNDDLQTNIASPAPPLEEPPISKPSRPQTGHEIPPNREMVPGHFPGVSVSYEADTHRPTPPDGTPRTVPEEREIILPDGRRLIGATLDETWRVPLRLKANP